MPPLGVQEQDVEVRIAHDVHIDVGSMSHEPEYPIARWWLGLRRPPCVASQWGHMHCCWMQGCEAVLALWWLGRPVCHGKGGTCKDLGAVVIEAGFGLNTWMQAPEGQTLSGLLQCVLHSL